jgi:hypothetical protein
MVGRPGEEAAVAGNWDAILVPGLSEEVRQQYIRINDLGALAAFAGASYAWACTPGELQATGSRRCSMSATRSGSGTTPPARQQMLAPHS